MSRKPILEVNRGLGEMKVGTYTVEDREHEGRKDSREAGCVGIEEIDVE